jgi:hypothetical protein
MAKLVENVKMLELLVRQRPGAFSIDDSSSPISLSDSFIAEHSAETASHECNTPSRSRVQVSSSDNRFPLRENCQLVDAFLCCCLSFGGGVSLPRFERG